MQDIQDILKAQGIEVTEEQMKAIKNGVLENYRSKAETEAKAAKVKELETQLEKANAALESASKVDPAKSEEIEALKTQIAEYEKAETERKTKEAETASRSDFKAKFDAEIGAKKFVSKVVGDAIFNAAYTTAKANPDMSIADVLKTATGDDKGIFANPQADPEKMPMGEPTAQGVQPIQSLEQVKGMSVEDVRKHMDEINKLLNK